MGLAFLSLVISILALPISEGFRNQLLGIIGLLASGLIAFSSTTVVANLMAGILLRITKPFRVGDFVRVGTLFGRVTQRGLFDTEVQSENRELVAIPNTYLINNPVTTIRSSGTIVSTTLSLGFDVHHAKAEPLLLQAAESCGLEEPFVHIIELGSYAVTYRISGFLAEPKHLLTTRSNLCRNVLDVLHDHAIEIMSPTYMNQRQLPADRKVVPARVAAAPAAAGEAEAIVFDKAEQAEQLERDKWQLQRGIEELEAMLKGANDEERAGLKVEQEEYRASLASLENAEAPSGEEAPAAKMPGR